MTRWIVLDLRRCALGDQLAEVQDVNAVGDPHDQVHVVLDHQDGQVVLIPDLAG